MNTPKGLRRFRDMDKRDRIASLRKLYGEDTAYTDSGGLVGVWHKETGYYDWYRFDVKAGRYLSTGSTQTLGDDVTAHSEQGGAA